MHVRQVLKGIQNIPLHSIGCKHILTGNVSDVIVKHLLLDLLKPQRSSKSKQNYFSSSWSLSSNPFSTLTLGYI